MDQPETRLTACCRWCYATVVVGVLLVPLFVYGLALWFWFQRPAFPQKEDRI